MRAPVNVPSAVPSRHRATFADRVASARRGPPAGAGYGLAGGRAGHPALGACAGLAALSAALAWPGSAAAHGLGGTSDLPIPAWLFAWGATLVLVVSFVGLAVLWQRPKLAEAADGRRLPVPVPALRVGEGVLSAVGLLVFVVVTWAALTGVPSKNANPAPFMVFVVFWVGVPVLSAVFGDLWRVLSPWRTIGRLAGAVVARTSAAGTAPLPWPQRLGRRPAAVVIVLFVVVELISSIPEDPFALGVLLVAYAAAMLVGQALFGVETWSENADGFAAWTRLAGSLAPVRWRRDGVAVRPPASGTARLATGTGMVALVVVLIGTTTFDGFSNTGLWGARDGLAGLLRQAGEALGLGAASATDVAGAIGLAMSIGFVGGLVVLGTLGMRRATGTSESVGGLMRTFAPSLVPIAVAYAFAHYWSSLVVDGQGALVLMSDPLGTGADLLGTAGLVAQYGIVQGANVWYVQVGALVIGHVAGLVLAHDIALRRFTEPRVAARSQYWMLAVMVAFTSLGLWLLSS